MAALEISRLRKGATVLLLGGALSVTVGCGAGSESEPGDSSASSADTGAEEAVTEGSAHTSANGDGEPAGSEGDDRTVAVGDADAGPLETGFDPSMDTGADAALDSGSGAVEAGPDAGLDAAAAADSSDGSTVPVVGMAAPCAAPSPSGELLFDVGHAVTVAILRQSGDRVLSEDTNGHWILWDTTHRAMVASGDASPLPQGGGGILLALAANAQANTDVPNLGFYPVEMVAGTVALSGPTSIALLSATDGHLLHTISVPDIATVPARFGLASDGSYVWIESQSNLLRAWSTSGKMLVNLPDDFYECPTFAAPTELRIAACSVGDYVIVSTVTGQLDVVHPQDSLPGFSFASWFLDGSRFITGVVQGDTPAGTTTLALYSAAGVMQGQVVLPYSAFGVVGQGDYFWTTAFQSDAPSTSPVQVFAVGGPSAPVWVGPPGTVAGAGGTLLAISDAATRAVHLVDLSGTAVAESVVTIPGGSSQFDADSTGAWSATGGLFGTVVYDSADATVAGGPRPLNCGRVSDIAGAASGRVAIATDADQVLYIDLQPTSRSLAGSLAFGANELAISSDGSVLAAFGPQGNTPGADWLTAFDLTSGALTYAVPEAGGLDQFFLSLGGTTLATLSVGFDSATRDSVFTRQLTSLGTGMTSLTDAYEVAGPGTSPPIALSPDGTLAAMCDFSANPRTPNATTNIFSGGRIVGTAHGYPVGFIDNARLVVKAYAAPDASNEPPAYAGSTLCDPQGTPLGPLNVPELNVFTPVGTTQIYAPETNTIYNIADGSVAWTSPDTPQGITGDVAGGYVVLFTDHRVLAEPH
jgi:hypothetical protein